MITLIKIAGITIEMSTFIAFFLGIGIGFLLLLLLYLYAVLRSMKKELKLTKTQEEDIDEEEIKWMIQESKKTFQNKKLREEIGYGTLLLRELKELSVDISKKFYPESPYPYLELTVDESLLLVKYITERVESFLDIKLVSMFRGMTIRRIAEINRSKNIIEESRVVKAVKKRKLGKIASSALKVMNAVNPFYWFRKATVDQVVNIITVRIGLAIIDITGEETYKVYSKKVFEKDVDLESSVDDIYEEIKKDIYDVEKDGEEYE